MRGFLFFPAISLATGSLLTEEVFVKILSCLFCICFLACSAPSREDGFSLASYNVQTLFDDQLDGNEFSEFVPSADGWNSKKYHNRLRQLSRVIRDLDEGAPDILVLQEIEHAGVIEDIDRYFIRDLDYGHVAVGGQGGLSMAVLSRRPFLHTQVHGMQWENTTLRPLLEVHLKAPASDRVILFAVHWKSKRGGEAYESEELRRASAHALVRAIMEGKQEYPQAHIVVAGDFNENIDEFSVHHGEYQTAIMPVSQLDSWLSSGEEIIPLFVAHGQQHPLNVEGDIPVLYHLWEEGEGSYFFRQQWEKIDSILFSQEFFATYSRISFRVADAWYLLDSSSRPRKYQQRSSGGYSDHLPIIIEFSLE